MEEKFICSFCGAEYDSAPARARCELECNEKRKQEAKNERRRKLQEEKHVRLEEINAARKHYSQLVKAYCKDYQTDNCSDNFWKEIGFPVLDLFGRW